MAQWVIENRLEPEEAEQFLENPSTAQGLVIERAIEDESRRARITNEDTQAAILVAKLTALDTEVEGYDIAKRGRQFHELMRMGALNAEEEARFEDELFTIDAEKRKFWRQKQEGETIGVFHETYSDEFQRISELLDSLEKARLFFVSGKIDRETYERIIQSISK